MDRKHIFLALLLLLVIAISLYFTLHEQPLTPIQPPEEQQGAEEELKDVSFSIFNQAQDHELQLDSDKVDNYQSQNRMELRPVEMKVYSTITEELLYTLNGDLGYYFSDRDYIEVMGNVKIESDNYYIEADVLDYFIDENYLEGRSNIYIEGRNFNAGAVKFSSDLNLRDLKLFGAEDDGKVEVDFEDINEETNND